jgi:hypothetical protein
LVKGSVSFKEDEEAKAIPDLSNWNPRSRKGGYQLFY